MTNLKKNLAIMYKVFFRYKAGFRYLYYRYIVAQRITKWRTPLERNITHPNLSIHMLTCHRDAVLAAWSLASYYASSKAIGHLTLHNDGSLTQAEIVMFKRLFPSATIVNAHNFFSEHRDALREYPILKKFRSEFTGFQAKKIIDVYFEAKADIILFLDSDLLWFKNPKELVDAIDTNDVRTYTYMMSNHPERIHVTFKDGSQTDDKTAECNSGIILFHRDNYELGKVSTYISRVDYLSKESIFSDQACFGTVLEPVRILPRDTYFIKGGITQDTVMRHYTGPSREKFYFYGINRIYKDILKKGNV